MREHPLLDRRARRGPLIAAWILGGLALVAGPLATPAPAGVRAPLEGMGDFRFLADLPTQPAGAGASRVDLTVRIDHAEIRPADAPERWQRRVAVALKIAREGWIAVDTLQVFEARGDAAVREASVIAFEVFELSAQVEPGRWAVTVTATLIGDGGATARATGVLEVPLAPASGPRLGDPEFRVRSAGISLPHPQRLYGVLQDTLEVYYEITGAEAGQRIGIEMEVSDPIHGGMDEQLVWLDPEDRRSGFLFRLPLGSFPEGVYQFAMRMAHPEVETPRETQAEFVVSWRMERSLQSSDDVRIEATLLLPSDEQADFFRLSRVAQSQRMQQFWDERDPTPGTQTNELQVLFAERVDHARRHYGEARTPGPLTARGRTYVRYGPPHEIDVEVIPADGADLDEAIERVHDSFATPLEGVIAREQENQTDLVGLKRPVRDATAEVVRDRLRNQARVGQEGSFELWIYRGDGDPLFESSAVWGESLDLRFLFVDRLGIGQFELEFSNLPNPRE